MLVLLVLLLAGPPLVVGFGTSPEVFYGVISLAVFAAILSLCVDRHQRLFALLLGPSTILFLLASQVLGREFGSWIDLIGHINGALFLFGAAALIVRSLFRDRRVTLDAIHGTVCGYLFLGLAWAMCYSMVESFRPGSFAIGSALRNGGAEGFEDPQVLTYYSFVTLTTVGYGDVTPISPTARTLAWLEAITGQFYLAVIVAGLVSMLAARGQSDRQHKDR